MSSRNQAHSYYNELEIPSSATLDDIKDAYRRLAREFHPDINPSEDARLKFSRIQQAYQILSDAQLRADYDTQKGILTQVENGFLNSSQKLRNELKYAEETETAYYINRKSKLKNENSLLGTLKSLLPEGVLNNSLVKKEWARRPRQGSKPPEKERVYSFSIDEMEALTGTTRVVFLNYNGAQHRRDLPIPPIATREKKLKIKLARTDAALGYDEVKIIVKVNPNPYFKRKGFDIQISVPMLREELSNPISMTVATTEGFETITLDSSNLETPLIIPSGGLWDKDRSIHGNLSVKAFLVKTTEDKKNRDEVRKEREKTLFILSGLKKSVQT